MNTSKSLLRLRRFFAMLSAGLIGAVVGCDAPEARFHMNVVYVKKQEESIGAPFAKDQKQLAADIMTAVFGTPDDPFLNSDPDTKVNGVLTSLGLDEVLDLDKLKLSAGPVRSVGPDAREGLYRRHCSHCHGVTGDGAGPTAAFLNPYPRDYRRGIFKFKSTPKDIRPTDDDLRRILVEGIPGTAMPSFRLLDEDEIDSLVDYVKYLAIRGEAERALIEQLGELDYLALKDAGELTEEERESLEEMSNEEKEVAKKETEEGIKNITSKETLVDIILSPIAENWATAEENVTVIPPRPDWDEEKTKKSIALGKDLFFGLLANCFTCHGDTALGDGQRNDYDDWSKDFTDWTVAMDPADRHKREEEYVSLGGLRPRNIFPRNLRQGIYRGGRRPIDIYRRLRNGIDGTPMPAVPLKPEGQPNAAGLTTDDIWHLVDYILSLPYESISQPLERVPSNLRERL